MEANLKYELRQMFADHEERAIMHLERAVERAVYDALAAAGVAKTHVAKSAAYAMFGRAAVDRWISGGWLVCMKDKEGSSRCRIAITDLERVARQFNHPSVKGYYKKLAANGI